MEADALRVQVLDAVVLRERERLRDAVREVDLLPAEDRDPRPPREDVLDLVEVRDTVLETERLRDNDAGGASASTRVLASAVGSRGTRPPAVEAPATSRRSDAGAAASFMCTLVVVNAV